MHIHTITKQLAQFLRWESLADDLLQIKDLVSLKEHVIQLRLRHERAKQQLLRSEDQIQAITPFVLDAETMCNPGMYFKGNIKIPSSSAAFGRRVDYKLAIRRNCIDEDGNPVTIALHSAHDDEQACIFKSFENSEGLTQIEYSDFETHCQGIVSVEQRSLTGTVMQYEYGDGYRIASNQLEHTFNLDLDLASARQCDDNAMYHEWELRVQYALSCSYYFAFRNEYISNPSIDGDTEAELVDGLKTYDELLTLLSEVNAMFLRLALKFSEMEFETEIEKKQVLARYTALGVNRHAAQRCWDAVTTLSMALRGPTFRTLTKRYETIDQALALEIQRLDHKTHTLFNRIDMCYNRFHNALRGAESRMANEIFRSMIIYKLNPDVQGEEIVCCICFCAVEFSQENTTEENLQTPCGHYFHALCAKKWFHKNDSCPLCRSKLEPSRE